MVLIEGYCACMVLLGAADYPFQVGEGSIGSTLHKYEWAYCAVDYLMELHRISMQRIKRSCCQLNECYNLNLTRTQRGRLYM